MMNTKSPAAKMARPGMFLLVTLAILISYASSASGQSESTYDCAAQTDIPQVECEALVALYNANPDGSFANSWLDPERQPCDWFRVTCNSGSVTELQLYQHRLSIIPPEIGNLDQLVELNLANNQITEMPSEFWSLSSLQSFSWSGNSLTTIPSEIGNLTSLTELIISFNGLRSLPPEIGNLTNLTDLVMGYNNIAFLPPEVGNLTQLPELDLRNNQIEALPSEIGNLTGLTTLDLNGNRLTTLPPEIGNLTGLQQVELQSNRLTSLPPEIGNLVALNRLNVTNNALLQLPSEIGGLSSLSTLDLEHNNLSSLPSTLGNLSNLRNLDLSSNKLASIPAEISNLSMLEFLDLSDNQFASLPSGIGELALLTALNLSDNPLLDGPMPATLTNLLLSSFYFHGTNWCTGNDANVDSWLAFMGNVLGTGYVCGEPAGAIQGVLTGNDGELIGHTSVSLYRSSSFSRNLFVDVGRTNAQGEYSFDNLGRDIEYYVYASSPNEQLAPQYYDDPRIENATGITVQLGLTTTADISLATPVPPLAAVVTTNGSITSDPISGRVSIAQLRDHTGDITVTDTIVCDDESVPDEVLLRIGSGEIYTMNPTGAPNVFTFTIPAEDIRAGGQLRTGADCPGGFLTVVVGEVDLLYEPMGRIVSGTTGRPIEGAVVTLHHVPNWYPRIVADDTADDKCQSNYSKEPGMPWSQPAPTDLGMPLNPEVWITVDPLSVRQYTDSNGYYGWRLPDGCWYVTVQADGYESVTSSVVGTTSSVTGLNLVLFSSDEVRSYLPFAAR